MAGTEKIRIKSLLVSQAYLRYEFSRILAMSEYVRNGGLWTLEAVQKHAAEHGEHAGPIAITRFPDGTLMLHDGHHRVAATILAQRRYLMPGEYIIYEMTYEQYLTANLDVGFYTPFDPRTEVRFGDFHAFKKVAVSLPREEALQYIIENKNLYCRPRKIKDIRALMISTYQKDPEFQRVWYQEAAVLKDQQPYHGCKIYHPDGTLLCLCRQDRVEWYIERGLATVVDEPPLSIRLNFVPKGKGHAGDEFHLTGRRNQCVVCGADTGLTKHHCVPSQYRKYLPNFYKQRDCHDVLLLCVTCHRRYEIESQKLSRTIGTEFELYESLVEDDGLTRVKKMCFSLVRFGDRIPAARREAMRSEITVLLGHEPTELEMTDLCKKKLVSANSQKPLGQTVVESLTTPQLQNEFVRRWREHFLTSMLPAFLPSHWDVNRPIYQDISADVS